MRFLAGISLSDMEVVTNKDGFFSGGNIWLSPDRVGGEPQITTINLSLPLH